MCTQNGTTRKSVMYVHIQCMACSHRCVLHGCIKYYCFPTHAQQQRESSRESFTVFLGTDALTKLSALNTTTVGSISKSLSIAHSRLVPAHPKCPVFTHTYTAALLKNKHGVCLSLFWRRVTTPTYMYLACTFNS